MIWIFCRNICRSFAAINYSSISNRVDMQDYTYIVGTVVLVTACIEERCEPLMFVALANYFKSLPEGNS